MGVKKVVTTKPAKNLKPESIISIQQFDQEKLSKLFTVAQSMKRIALNARPAKTLAGKIVVLLFFEPSSRTLSSFDAAVKQLGGQTIVINNPNELSSIAKGETFEDTIKTLEAYCDAIVIRHPKPGFAEKAANAALRVPIINAGDGTGEHPTQALLDMYTIWERKKRLGGLNGLVVGDLLNGRTVHSLLRGLSLYPGNSVCLISPKELTLPRELLEEVRLTGLRVSETNSIDNLPTNCNFWYWTRVQKERFLNIEDYNKVNNKFIVTKELLDKFANSETILMHPLPRVGEIDKSLDQDRRSVYLGDQVRNGMYTRMALLSLILAKK